MLCYITCYGMLYNMCYVMYICYMTYVMLCYVIQRMLYDIGYVI